MDSTEKPKKPRKPRAKKEKKPKAPKAPKAPGLELLSTLPETAFNTAGPTRALCVKCKRLPVAGSNTFVPKEYTKNLLVVFETPPTTEAVTLFRELAKEAGYGHEDIAWVSAVRCGTDKPSMDQIRCCRPYVLRAIDYLAPSLVIAAGPSATRSLTNLGTKTNITKLRGRPLQIQGRAVPSYATYNPESVLQGGIAYRERIIEDLKRQYDAELPHPPDEMPRCKGALGVDTEYAPDKSLLTLSVANLESAAVAEVDEPDYVALTDTIQGAPILTNLVGHNVPGDLDYLVSLGLGRAEWVDGTSVLDSLLLARMADENRGKGGYELESLLTSDRKVTPWKQHTEAYDKANATTWPVDLRRERCRLDAWAACVVADDNLVKVLDERQPVQLTHQIAMALHRIELAGVYIDSQKFDAMRWDLTAEAARYKDLLTKKAQALGMASFNPTNDDNLRELLFKKLQLTVIKKTKKEKLPSVDQTTLKQYLDREEVELLFKFNKADKALSTNITGVAPLIQPMTDAFGWLPVHINPLGARTGRRSSERPNMQNWPTKTRQMVVSRYPGGSILEYDYKSLEVFLLAFEAKDDKLYDYFANKGGYIAVAKDMWGAEVQKGSTQYKATKSVVLGTNYNMQTALMAENLWLMGVRFSADYDAHTDKVDELRNAYLDMFPGLRPYMERQRKYLLANQCARTLTGRVRHLKLTNGKKTPGFGRLVNQAINFPIQGLAADVTGSALVDCERVICGECDITLLDYHNLVLTRGWTDRPIPLIINEVHDNLLFDVPWGTEDPRTVSIAGKLKQTMEAVDTLRALVPSFTLPLRVEMKIGPTWGMED